MSTGYGSFKDRLSGKDYYADASQIHERINLCGADNTDVLLSIDHENTEELLIALSLAFDHNGWIFTDPTGTESVRNLILVRALRAALKQEPCWRDTAEAALHNAGYWK